MTGGGTGPGRGKDSAGGGGEDVVGRLPPEAYAAALADLPGIGPARLAGLLSQASPEAVWAGVLSGSVQRPAPRNASQLELAGTTAPVRQPGRAWSDVASQVNLGQRWQSIKSAGIGVVYLGGPGMPAALADDSEPPGVLFARGDLALLDRPCVALIGTRNCTSYGRSMAFKLGRDLAASGVCVVSGLALGIDGAAHEGALAAPAGAGTVGVAASGVDVAYPLRHRDLWRRVSRAGAIISETAPGRPAQAWRFPARNRLIAALSAAVVVVESHAGGGSMLTVAAAAERGTTVLAVPGPVSSAASLGTNQLLYDGVTPVRDAGDVLAALGDLRPWPPPEGQPSAARGESGGPGPGVGWPANPSPRLRSVERLVLDAVDVTPTATSSIAARTGVSIGELSVVLLALEAAGLIHGQGLWWERCVR